MNRKQRLKNKKTYNLLKNKLFNNNPAKYLPVCSNCGEYGLHFVPPCFGDRGFYFCKPLLMKELT